jgi:hypothetical protein
MRLVSFNFCANAVLTFSPQAAALAIEADEAVAVAAVAVLPEVDEAPPEDEVLQEEVEVAVLARRVVRRSSL